jgi:transposase
MVYKFYFKHIDSGNMFLGTKWDADLTWQQALINQLRALLLERGIVVPQGRRKLETAIAELLAEDGRPAGLSARMRQLVVDMQAEWQELDRRIFALDDEFAACAKTSDTARRQATIPGIGVLNATALAAALGDARSFARARDVAAWLGLVPRQATTGGKPRLLGISKRGNRYLRRNLIHGARAALPGLAAGQTPLGRWLRGLLGRVHKNKVITALASKLARIAWAVLTGGGSFEPGRAAH